MTGQQQLFHPEDGSSKDPSRHLHGYVTAASVCSRLSQPEVWRGVW